MQFLNFVVVFSQWGSLNEHGAIRHIQELPNDKLFWYAATMSPSDCIFVFLPCPTSLYTLKIFNMQTDVYKLSTSFPYSRSTAKPVGNPCRLFYQKQQ